MKRLSHALFAFAVAVASCQCGVVAWTDDAALAAEACHDTGDMQDTQKVHSATENCCEQPATFAETKQTNAPDLVATQVVAIQTAASFSEVDEVFAHARRQQPPPKTTPTSKHDCLLI